MSGINLVQSAVLRPFFELIVPFLLYRQIIRDVFVFPFYLQKKKRKNKSVPKLHLIMMKVIKKQAAVVKKKLTNHSNLQKISNFHWA